MVLFIAVIIILVIVLAVRNDELKNKMINKEVLHAKEKFYSKYSGCDYYTLIRKYNELKSNIEKKKIIYGRTRFEQEDYTELCGRLLACKEWISRKEPDDIYLDSIDLDKIDF